MQDGVAVGALSFDCAARRKYVCVVFCILYWGGHDILGRNFGLRLLRAGGQVSPTKKTNSTIIEMQADKNQYTHALVKGLPKSLLEIDTGTFKVITIMQRKAGLNRDLKREIQSDLKTSLSADQILVTAASKTDRNILAVYLDPGLRWYNFWLVARRILRRKPTVGTKAYACAVDIQLLDAYDPTWQKLPLENNVLLETCFEWKRIRETLKQLWSRGGQDEMPLGVFMLWPRLVKDLQRWQELDADQRTRVGHAVFSLSSIGATHWFIDEAISICQDLEQELGELVSPTRKHTDSPAVPETLQPEMLCDDATADSPEDAAISEISALSCLITEELARLHTEWKSPPTRSLLRKLIELGNHAAKLFDAIPEEDLPSKVLERQLEALRKRINEAAGGSELPWLTDEDQSGIMARWHLSAADAQDDESLLLLAKDAEMALDRLATAIEEMRLAQANVDSAKQALSQLDMDLARPASAVQKLDLTNRQLRAKEELLGAERKFPEAMLFVLASGSPYGEAYDPNVNYAAQMAGNVPHLDSVNNAQIVKPAETVGDVDPPGHPSDGIETEIEELESQNFPMSISAEKVDLQKPDESPTSFRHEYAQRKDDAEIDELAAAIKSIAEPAVGEYVREAGLQLDFTMTAGDDCRPIWTLLKMGRPALAYHYATALHASFPGLRVPPPALLRSVALAPGLIAGDGPLAISIGEAFGEIDQAWFEPGETPSNWHTALNLLLIAATLRPMVLAPAMGAAAIASYRHLNGRYSALLQLVRTVGEVSEPLTGFAIGPAVLRSAANEASQNAQLARLQKDAEDWLFERAPNKKIRYAPASKVWLHWLKPGEPIHKLISPVARGATEERNTIRAAIEEFADYYAFQERVTDTDRRQLGRRGQDIEAGALEHLWVLTCEAVTLAKEWLGAETMLSDSGGRLRSLIRQLQAAFDTYAEQACNELSEVLEADQWGQVDAASRVLRSEIEGIVSLFGQSEATQIAEPQAKDLVARDLLLVPGVTLSQEWTIESSDEKLLDSLEAWSVAPTDAAYAFDTRVRTGDFAGATLLLQHLPDGDGLSGRKQMLDKTREAWTRDLRNKIQEARRASEVGLAYGYLSDGERAACESELSAVELNHRDSDRFDQAMILVESVLRKIDEQKASRIHDARSELAREKPSLPLDVARQVEAPLVRDDIHTFNELMQRVRQGMDPWPEREVRKDSFQRFFPALQAELLSQLARMEAPDVDKMIRSGGAVGPLSFDLEGDEQARVEAEGVYRAWAFSVARRGMSRDNMRRILDALGMKQAILDQDRGAWSLQILPIMDREVCAVPHFGSRAQG